MVQNIIEYGRELAVKQLFKANGFNTVWNSWKKIINSNYLSCPPTQRELYDLGDNLRNIFKSTTQTGRSQSDIASGGAVWESLVCWYLNLCTIGRRTFVIKHNKALIPEPINRAITVNYGNFPSNTESDLIAITFPNKHEYTIDKQDINIQDSYRHSIDTVARGKYQFLPVLNALVDRDFSEIEIHIIQCKTNWNDNAQIPMLWDAVYSAKNFRNNIHVGDNGYSIHDVKTFTYSFVTVPTNKIENDGHKNYKNTSTSVLRVKNLSGGNYWGLPSESGIASSVKELLERNLKTGSDQGLLTTISNSITSLTSDYNYFKLL